MRRIIDSPLLQPRNKGLSCRVRFHHPNLLFVSFSRRVQRPLCCTRTPTAVKGNAFARFRTTACRLRNDRTLSASGRFSTWDSPPSIPLNLYSKGAAPREGLLLFSGSDYSIAVRFLFVNDLINKNQAECSAKTPNFPASRQRPLQRGALADSLRRRAKGKPPCVSVGAQRQQLRFSGRSERRSDRRRSSRPGPGPCVFTSRMIRIRPLYVPRREKMHEPAQPN